MRRRTFSSGINEKGQHPALASAYSSARCRSVFTHFSASTGAAAPRTRSDSPSSPFPLVCTRRRERARRSSAPPPAASTQGGVTCFVVAYQAGMAAWLRPHGCHPGLAQAVGKAPPSTARPAPCINVASCPFSLPGRSAIRSDRTLCGCGVQGRMRGTEKEASQPRSDRQRRPQKIAKRSGLDMY
ncbi:hypothetical protein SAMN05216320_104242 [Duganella sp. OV458]|nr:hypothetical protein SAMN05216320_104242 [Duganella sp. OV458]SDJ62738.1 hypothetical protein SAMN05428973_105162 [Duganella sp. OV510]